MSFIEDLLRAGAGYYTGKEGIKGATQVGSEGLALSEGIGTRASDATQFQPYGVTSSLANVGVGAGGGFNLSLSPEQQALQDQLLGQAQGMFGAAGSGDFAGDQAALYEQIRATQRPDEERNRQATESRLLSQGRLGLSSSAYGGGSPEMFAQEAARQEAMGRANLGARNQLLSEREQSIAGGMNLMNAGFAPQTQAMGMLGQGVQTGQLAQRGQLRGAELQAAAGSQGVESYLQGAKLANNLQQQQLQGMASGLFGSGLSPEQQFIAQLLGGGEGGAGGMMGALGVGGGNTPAWLKALGDRFGFGGASGLADSASGLNNDWLQRYIEDQGIVVNDQGDGYNPIPDSDGDGVNDIMDDFPQDPNKT
tara:strand:+ start:121 stop:1218 length:1098 start_codon:yes stop_codon:yes gene_type:complete